MKEKAGNVKTAHHFGRRFLLERKTAPHAVTTPTTATKANITKHRIAAWTTGPPKHTLMTNANTAKSKTNATDIPVKMAK